MKRTLFAGLLAISLVACSSNALAGQPLFGDTNYNDNSTTNAPVALGGSANAGAAAGAFAGAAAGAASGSYSDASVGDVSNTAVNTAFGGAGGRGGDGGNAAAFGGDAKQSQSNVGINGQSLDSKISNSVGQAQNTDASSANANDNRSSANGNATNVGGQTVNISSNVQAKRNAPSISGGTVFPTASCKGGFGIGGSGAAGGGLLNIATTDKECQTVLLGDHFASIGMPETACDLYKTTKTWERALKKNPNIRAACDAPVPPVADTKPAAEPMVWKYHTVIEGGKKQ